MPTLSIRRRRYLRPSPVTAAEIAPAACGGFLLLLMTGEGDAAELVDLGLRLDEYDHHPDSIEILRADLALTERGLTRAADWTAKPCGGCPTAPVTATERTST